MTLSDKALATQQRILEAATELFYLNGYHATGLDKVISQAGVTKGNFYYHFKSKEILACATLDWQADHIINEIKTNALKQKSSPLQQLYALLTLMAKRQKQQYIDGHVCGCYFGNFTLELSSASQLVRDKVKQIFKHILELIESLLGKAIKTGEISSEINPEQFSKIILGQMEGAILLDKENQQPDNLVASIEFIKHYLSTCALGAYRI